MYAALRQIKNNKMRNKDKLDFINQIVEEAEKQCDIHVVSITFVCEHPKRQRDYYSDTTYKCWKCKKIVVAN